LTPADLDELCGTFVKLAIYCLAQVPVNGLEEVSTPVTVRVFPLTVSVSLDGLPVRSEAPGPVQMV
jgi:hypothetical protein